MSNDRKVFALLIDGDNAQPSLIPQILDKIKQYGDIGIKRVYGDWSQEQLKVWREIVNRYALGTPHRFNGSKNKNATDIALVIDAMDILHLEKDRINAFCIVSSDSDFAHLAIRIREQNLMVLGIGIENTPFREVCDEFITIESLQPAISNNGVTTTATSQPIVQMTFESLFVSAYESCFNKNLQNNEGFIPLQPIREIIKELNSDGYTNVPQKMPDFVTQTKNFTNIYSSVITLQELNDNKPVIHYIAMDHVMVKFWMAYKYVIEVYRFVSEDADWITLSALGQALNELYPNESHKPAKVMKVVKKLVEQYPNIVEFREDTDGEEKTHYVRIKSEIEKFLKAYTEVIKMEKVSHVDGWIALSPLGSTVRKLYPEYDPLTYRSTKHNQLKKVMTILSQDYPTILEIKTDEQLYIRMVIQSK